MDLQPHEISELLQPYLGFFQLKSSQVDQISIYINVLQKWNARTTLTALRTAHEIVQRHFGESFFLATRLLTPESKITAADVGSGAGFPGIPLKIFAPDLKLTLIESHGKKATFLREVCRSLKLNSVTVFSDRAERFDSEAELVTMRAVEKFTDILAVAARLVSSEGRLALLIGESQVESAKELLGGTWNSPVPIPSSSERVLLVRNL